MQERKKIISTVLKLTIGLASFAIIYFRLRSNFTSDKLELLYASVFSLKGILCFTASLFLIPINWGIESYKWKLITTPVEPINFNTAMRSIYSGVCLGNLAPGRATEFVAKILFFEPDNRPKITVLHFINGMFQFCITIILGLFALIYKLQQLNNSYWLAYLAAAIGVIILTALALSIYKIEFLLNLISKKISKENYVPNFKYEFSSTLILKLFSLSVLRYLAFFTQFILLISMLDPIEFSFILFTSASIYFLITSTIPMISFLEAAIRAAVAIFVFENTGLNPSAMALSAILLWFVNIVIPSIFGYYFLLKLNFNFKLFSVKK